MWQRSPISNIKEATEIANNSEYGLVASICTKNLAYVKEFAENIETGIVKVNRPTIGVELQGPFGGVKNSGSDTYREKGDMAIDLSTRIKTVYLGI